MASQTIQQANTASRVAPIPRCPRILTHGPHVAVQLWHDPAHHELGGDERDDEPELRAIRSDSELRDLLVVLAFAGEEASVEGLESGADDYLTKPFSARELVARMNANLEMARLRREAMRDLRESEARFRNMADHAPVMMWISTPAAAFDYLNQPWCEFTGQTLDEAIGEGVWAALHEEDRESSCQAFLDAHAESRPF